MSVFKLCPPGSNMKLDGAVRGWSQSDTGSEEVSRRDFITPVKRNKKGVGVSSGSLGTTGQVSAEGRSEGRKRSVGWDILECIRVPRKWQQRPSAEEFPVSTPEQLPGYPASLRHWPREAWGLLVLVRMCR